MLGASNSGSAHMPVHLDRMLGCSVWGVKVSPSYGRTLVWSRSIIVFDHSLALAISPLLSPDWVRIDRRLERGRLYLK